MSSSESPKPPQQMLRNQILEIFHGSYNLRRKLERFGPVNSGIYVDAVGEYVIALQETEQLSTPDATREIAKRRSEIYKAAKAFNFLNPTDIEAIRSDANNVYRRLIWRSPR